MNTVEVETKSYNGRRMGEKDGRTRGSMDGGREEWRFDGGLTWMEDGRTRGSMEGGWRNRLGKFLKKISGSCC